MCSRLVGTTLSRLCPSAKLYSNEFERRTAMTEDFLFLTTGKAAEYLSCSRDELIAWVKPERRVPGQVGPGSGERRWSKQTLDRAKPHVEAWRARDRAAAAQRAAAGNASQRRG